MLEVNAETLSVHEVKTNPNFSLAELKNRINFQNIKLFSLADIENILIDSIEVHAEDYQSFEWKPINVALERFEKEAKL